MKNEKTAGIFLSYILVAAEAVSGIVLTSVLLRNLGQSQYGIYKLASSWVALVSVLDFGLGGTVTRYVIKYRVEERPQDEEKFLGIVYAVYGVLAFLILLIGILLCRLVPHLTAENMGTQAGIFRTVFMLLIAKSALTLFNHAFVGRFTAEERFVYIKTTTLVSIVCRMAFCYLLLPVFSSPVAIAAIDFGLTAAQLACHIWATRRFGMAPVRYVGWDWKLFRELFVFTFAIFVTAVINQFNSNVDNLVLGTYSTLTAVGLYSSVTQIYTAYGTLSTAVQGVFAPQINRKVFQKRSDTEITESLVLPSRLQIIVLLLVLTGFIHFGDTFLSLWLGDAYSTDALREAYMVGLLLLGSATWQLFQNSTTAVLKAKNMLHGKIWITSAATAVNFVITILLVPRYGMLGAALGTAVSLLLGYGVAANIYYSAVVGISLRRYYKKTLSRFWYGIPIAFFSGFAVDAMPGNGIGMFCVKVLIYTSIYMTVIFFLCLNREEKEWIGRKLNKRKEKTV